MFVATTPSACWTAPLAASVLYFRFSNCRSFHIQALCCPPDQTLMTRASAGPRLIVRRIHSSELRPLLLIPADRRKVRAHSSQCERRRPFPCAIQSVTTQTFRLMFCD